MRNARRGIGWLVGGLLAGLAWSIVPATAHALVTSADKVKATAAATKPDANGNQTVTITLKVQPGWHLIANPVGCDLLTYEQTVVSFPAGQKLQVVKIDYPAGKLVEDNTICTYRIYEGTVVIKAKLKRLRGDTSPLQVNVKVRAMSTLVCILPAVIRLTVP